MITLSVTPISGLSSFKPNSKTIESVKLALVKASELYNVDYITLVKIADIESGFNHKASNVNSSSRGLFQIIKSTERWLRKTCEFTKKGSIFDPEVNALLGACLLKYNSEYLIKHLKRTPTQTELYSTHFFGAGSGLKFIRSNPNELGVKIFPRVSKVNQNIFFVHNRARTIKEIAKLFEKMLNSAKIL